MTAPDILAARLAQITSPAQRFYVAWHLAADRPSLALFVALMDSAAFASHDAAMALAYAMGRAARD